MPRILLFLFLSGLTFGFGPCLASCGPVILSYIAGTKKSAKDGLLVYLVFSAARVCVYLALGLLVFFFGRLFLDEALAGFSKIILMGGGIFIAAIGAVTLLGKGFGFRACGFLERNILEKDKKSIFLLGIIIGLLPCAPLLGILAYIMLVSKTWGESLFYAFTFGIGTLVSPLVLLSMFAGFIPKYFVEKKQVLGRILSVVCGLILIILGIQLLMRRGF
ncbi:MAG: sulfite exporter TauE/SafE family protein [Candidatus Omnitrophica bacterium]|nr:sulfite exporter TauE/SafE family protein [Candidatus Omnitrophota bacterium]